MRITFIQLSKAFPSLLGEDMLPLVLRGRDKKILDIPLTFKTHLMSLMQGEYRLYCRNGWTGLRVGLTNACVRFISDWIVTCEDVSSVFVLSVIRGIELLPWYLLSPPVTFPLRSLVRLSSSLSISIKTNCSSPPKVFDPNKAIKTAAKLDVSVCRAESCVIVSGEAPAGAGLPGPPGTNELAVIVSSKLLLNFDNRFLSRTRFSTYVTRYGNGTFVRRTL